MVGDAEGEKAGRDRFEAHSPIQWRDPNEAYFSSARNPAHLDPVWRRPVDKPDRWRAIRAAAPRRRPPHSQRERAARLGFFSFVLALGAAIAVGAVRDFADARASLAWPVVEGVVIQDDGRQRYTYSWEGRIYSTTRRRFFTGRGVGADAPTVMGRYAPLHVSPLDPAKSVLVAGGSPLLFAGFLALGAIFIFVGGGGLARAFSGADGDRSAADNSGGDEAV